MLLYFTMEVFIMKVFLEKSKQLKLLLILFLIYILGFVLLEHIDSSRVIYTQTWIDQYIPFNEYFIIPYVLWYVFIVVGFLYFLLNDEKGFYRTCFYLFAGMYACLILYLVFPSAQGLRVHLTHENIFQTIISFLYTVDTPTNVCPSIHVYNSVMMYVSLLKNEIFKEHRLFSIGIGILVIFICISTVMIKQHAFIDIIAALILGVIIYAIGKWKWNY